MPDDGVVELCERLSGSWFDHLAEMMQSSDRKGRLFVVGVTSIGQVIQDIVFVMVFLFSAHAKGGHWLLVLGIAAHCLSGGL
jgi:hypothetical protein